MSEPRPITIVGGGLAGLTLGIGLRQNHIPVRIIEAGTYPRHKVCGEFIHGRGLTILEHLGLKARIDAAGTVTAKTAIFYAGNNPSRSFSLEPTAFCISRYALDEALANEFRTLGGELHERERWNGTTADAGWIFASGRRPQPTHNGCRWYGLKVHARGVSLRADLEMHTFENAYVGLCRLPNDQVNICGLFRRSLASPPPSVTGQEELRGPPGSPLRALLDRAEFDATSFCSVAGLNLLPRQARQQQLCAIGDALTMIPPVTGNGMSMALESAAIAVAPVVAYCRGELSWEGARMSVAQTCDRTFARRLRWARRLQSAMFMEGWRSRLLPLALRSATLFNWMLTRTR
jgi:flavin-dependent dehydrogenase